MSLRVIAVLLRQIATTTYAITLTSNVVAQRLVVFRVQPLGKSLVATRLLPYFYCSHSFSVQSNQSLTPLHSMNWEYCHSEVEYLIKT